MGFYLKYLEKSANFRRLLVCTREENFFRQQRSEIHQQSIHHQLMQGDKPIYSFDLNPSEHLRDLLERSIRQHNVSSKDMLKSVLKDQWEKISAGKRPRFVSSMLKRLQEVHK
ncbi:hypothetical protein TNCV_2013601 [Trichonephila clavipes]|nr:hypothetical protein TNCV_2013601 [Trichonephila clavipes]